jgi:hypothetical protein
MVSSPRLARRMTSSYACQNWRKSICSHALIDGTTRLRLPSGLVRSIAMPRFTCSGSTTAGFPSASAKELFISGCVASAFISAYPIRWVKLTLPPRPRLRWLLITMRLSASSFAGTARTLVAVGTLSDASMFATIRAAMPRRTVVLPSVFAAGFAAGLPSALLSAFASALAGAAGLAVVGAAVESAGRRGASVALAVVSTAPASLGLAVAVVLPPSARAGSPASSRVAGSTDDVAPGASVPARAALATAVAAVASVGETLGEPSAGR